MPKAKTVLFLKAHVKDYTRKDGTVVRAHEDKRTAATGRIAADNYAEAAVASADRVSGDKSVHRGHCLEASHAALSATRGAKTTTDHIKAAQVHEDAAQNHRTAASDVRRSVATAGAGQDHGAAAQSHEWAAAAHRDEAKNQLTVAHEANRPLAARLFAKAAAEYAGRSKDTAFGEHGRKDSETGVGVSEQAKTARDHMKAGQLHRDLANGHRAAVFYMKKRGDANPEDIKAHGQAYEAHQMAASLHEQEASKGK